MGVKKHQASRPRLIAFYSPQGGVGVTQYTASTCIRGQEHGLDVVGATLGWNHDLRPQLGHAGVRWQDGLDDLRRPATSSCSTSSPAPACSTS
jgi:hypothetical protein